MGLSAGREFRHASPRYSLAGRQVCSGVDSIQKGISGRCPSCVRLHSQSNNLNGLSFLDGNGHGAAARAAEPEILELSRMALTRAALILDFSLGYEQPAFAESVKFRSARGISTLVKHSSL